jgi:hypothetical protein
LIAFRQASVLEQMLHKFKPANQDETINFGLAMSLALSALSVFDVQTRFTFEDGIPMAGSDIGFYIGYKQGYKVVGAQINDKVFYGTMPGTTLEEQGVQVDVQISPTYGYSNR